MEIPRIQFKWLQSSKSNKATVIYGPRRIGKTTLLKKYLKDKENYLFVTGEGILVSEALSSTSIDDIRNFLGDKKLLVIDEAQYIPNISRSLKLIVDQIDDVKVIVTGSSTFDLTKQIGEPLTGRQETACLFPISQLELNEVEQGLETKSNLEKRLLYGSYPEVLLTSGALEKQKYLRELVSSYLLKDVLAFEGVRKSKKMLDLLILLALQIGKEVSLSEIGMQLSMSKTTVERYLDLLEKSFVLVNIRGFSRNLRKEVTKTSRYYFYDNGIRNALVNNFNLLSCRDDVGMLWENYLVIERLKKQAYQLIWSNNYFWRTYDQKELDWVEEREGRLYGFEFRWKKTKSKEPKLWKQTYQNASFECISQSNYLDFIA